MAQMVKTSACNAGDLGSIPGSGRIPGEGNGSPLQYSCLGNPMDRGAWWLQTMKLQESQTRLTNFFFDSVDEMRQTMNYVKVSNIPELNPMFLNCYVTM